MPHRRIDKTGCAPGASQQALAPLLLIATAALHGCASTGRPASNGSGALPATAVSVVFPGPLLREVALEMTGSPAAFALHPAHPWYSRNDIHQGRLGSDTTQTHLSASITVTHDHQHHVDGKPFNHFHSRTRTVEVRTGR